MAHDRLALMDGTGFNIKSKNPYAENLTQQPGVQVIYIPTLWQHNLEYLS